MTHKIILLIAVLFPVLAQAEIRVALTVDDLPAHLSLPPDTTRLEIAEKIISALQKNKVREAYGFINAGKMESDGDLIQVLKAWRAAGFPLGNHTYTHPNINDLSVDAFKKEIEANENTLKDLSEKTEWRYFRYPFLAEGNTLEKKNAVRSYLFEKGYKIAEVTLSFNDWGWNDPYARCVAKGDRKSIEWLKKSYLENAITALERSEQLSQAVFKRSIPQVLLLHIGGFDAQMLDLMLQAYRAKGVRFIPLSEALADEAYTENYPVVFDSGALLTDQAMKAKSLTLKELGLRFPNRYPSKELDSICK